ncbi:MAG TPA: hypothetical protein VEO56_05915 [Bacteroidota bacterium]|nr:hypothetical protein [Bacteroidota bacterium]
MRHCIPAVALTLIVACGCHKDEPSAPCCEPLVSAYPLAKGMTWQYSYYSAYYNIRTTDSSAINQLDTVSGISTVVAAGDTVLGPVGAQGGDSVRVSILAEYRVQLAPKQVVSSGPPGCSLYSAGGSGIYLEGYSGIAGHSLPKVSPGPISMRVAGRVYSSRRELVASLLGMPNSPSDEPIVREIPPKLTIRIPLAIGTSWTFRPSNGTFGIDKQVTGEEDFTLSGKTYPCAVVRWLYSMSSGDPYTAISVVDLISPNGLLKRTIDLKNVVITTMTNPDSAGLMDYREEYFATDVHAN